MPNLERRHVVGRAEIRAGAGGLSQIAGHAAVFGVEAVIGGKFRERIMPGAFRGVIKTDVRSLFNHDVNYVLGRTSAGTLTIAEDATGLGYTVTPPASRRDVLESVERGDVTGSSYGFRVAEGGDEWTRATRSGELPLRTIHEIAELLDVGPVTYPAFEESSAEARSAAEAHMAHMAPASDSAVPAEPLTMEEAEEAGELVQYQTAASALAACAAACAAASVIVAALIADESETPTEGAAAEAAEEEVETARLRSLLVLCEQAMGACAGVRGLALAMLSEEYDPIVYMRNNTPAAETTATRTADEDRSRRFRLAASR